MISILPPRLGRVARARATLRRYSSSIFRRSTPFALLSYRTDNLGDFIQSLAARNFVRSVDRYLDREELNEMRTPDGTKIKVVLNGWFCHRPDRWPPAPCIDPLLISFHVTNNPEPGSGMRAREEFSRMPHVLRYLHEKAPVGARDYFTLEWLQSQGIDSYYSGCLTLTFQRPAVPREPFIVINDLSQEVAARVEAVTELDVRRTTHHDSQTVGPDQRIRKAEVLIDLYARASCVVTSRLHGALPCLAMGTPTLLIDESWDQSRFTGLNELVHHCTGAEFLSGEIEYDVRNPPPNPERHIGLRDLLTARTAAFVAD